MLPTPDAPIPLGPFDLLAPAGHGGMAHVWRARHRGRGVEVAVKVVTAGAGRDARFRAWFAEEIRAVARLDHPAVVRLHDHGTVDHRASARSGGALPAGAPYLVMDWLGGGAVDRGPATRNFSALRATLLRVLDGLGHAHARGLVHRDIKPANVLRGASGAVLTDFGLAFDAGSDTSVDRVSGTLGFMAPEQLRNDWRAFGPWTDLFAVGCLAWTLVTGRPLFLRAGAGRMAAVMATLEGPLPDFEPRFPVPVGLRAWLDRLLARAPGDRYAWAADAARALRALPDVDEAEGDTTEMALVDLRTEVSAPPTGSLTQTLVSGPGAATLAPATIAHGSATDTAPPFPASWETPDSPPAVFLPDVGRALFGARVLPPIGRRRARAALWEALRSVVEGGGARAVVVEGPAGSGKTHLARWLLHRAHEAGVADHLQATHEDPATANCGLAPMFARALRTGGLDGEALATQLRVGLGTDDAALRASVGALLQPDLRCVVEGVSAHLRSAAERHATACRLLARLALRRPRVVLLDDAQWGPDALELARHLQARWAELPVLLLLTVRSDGLRRGSEAAERLAALDATRLRLGPLAPADHAHLVRAMLPLAPQLVARVVDRTEGSPMFAAELVRHWIDSGALEPAPGGFRLRADADEALPASAQGVWAARLERALAEVPRAAAEGVELAAALGLGFDEAEWADACVVAGLPHPGAREALLDVGLLHRAVDGRLGFAHAMLRTVLRERARRAGRWARLHAACADALDAVGAEPARRAEHRLEAGQPERALPHVLAALDPLYDRNEFGELRRLIVRGAWALRAVGAGVDDPRRVWLRVTWASVCLQESLYDRGLRHARRAERAARTSGDARLHGRALFTLGSALHHTDGSAASIDIMRAAARRAGEAGEWRHRLRCLSDLAGSLAIVGRGDEAEAVLDEGFAELGGRDDPGNEGALHYYRAYLAAYRGQDLAAIDHARASRRCLERAGRLQNVATTWSIEGDARRRLGDGAGAERCYRTYSQRMVVVGPRERAYLALNLGLSLIAQERFEAARAELDRAAREDLRGPAMMIKAAQLAVAGHQGDWARWDALADGLGPAVRLEVLDPDIPWSAAHAARAAERVGAIERAVFARGLAVDQYEALDQPEAAAALREG